MQEGKDGPSSFQTTGRWPYFSEGSTEMTELEEAAATSLEPRQISVQMCTRHVERECAQRVHGCFFFMCLDIGNSTL